MAVLVVLSVGTGYPVQRRALPSSSRARSSTKRWRSCWCSSCSGTARDARAGRRFRAIRALMDLALPKATVVRDGAELTIPTADVLKGDVALIRPG